MTATAPPPKPTRSFVPADLDPSQWSQLEPIYQSLLDRPLGSVAELDRWLADYSELAAAVSEYGARVYIDKACHTDDKAIEARFLHWIGEIQPKTKPIAFALQKKYMASPHRGERDEMARLANLVMDREWSTEVEIYRDANVPLQVEEQKLIAEYDKLFGAMIVNFRGKDYTLQQMAKFYEDTDRATREAAWKLANERVLRDRDAIDDIFDKLLALRQTIAKNAGLDNYREYLWKQLYRFDYTPDDCLRFAETVEHTCVPLLDQMYRERRKELGLQAPDALRPWDLSVDVKGRPPLRPFDEQKIDDFVERCGTIFDRISSVLGEQFRRLKMGRNLDLESRKGKRPGGFQSNLEESRETFIFMNAAGLQGDVDTMLHEAGHAFHSMGYYTAVPLVFQRSPGMEFCEVASMSMELLASPHLDVFYKDSQTPDGTTRAIRKHLEGVIAVLPWIAIVDSFQHWLYTHPGHSRPQRREAWASLMKRLSTREVDWAGFEDAYLHRWQRQLHLFHVPFYYIEYGIAQLGALQVWFNYRKDPRKALTQLLTAFKLGNTRPMPQLFTAAGIKFDFSKQAVEPLIAAVRDELAKLPV